MTTTTYRTSGKLTYPVSDFHAARRYLREDDMSQYVDADLSEVVHSVEWDLESESEWYVTVVTERPLTEAESDRLSDWISGQNSDGLGEGFEQQPFAEHGSDWDEDEDFQMSSFDWEDNPCKLLEREMVTS